MILLWLVLLGASSATAADYALPAPPAPSTGTRHIDFVADHAEYDASEATFHLKGGVRVMESTYTVKGEDIYLDTRQRIGRSQGYLVIEDPATAVYGDFGEFDFQHHSGTLYHASAGAGDWRIHGRKVHIDENRKLDYYKADFTSCTTVPYHYHFHSTHITVVPHKYLFARNTVFFFRNVPLFYTPFLYKSLKDKHFLRFKLQPGYDRRNGAFVKATLMTDHTPTFTSKLYLDYYNKQGFGTGAELNHHGGPDSRGALYGYQISETSTSRERWALLGSAYEGFKSSFSAQARMQVQSDANFNNDYARASLFRVTPDLVNNGGVTYRMRHSSARLSYSRLDSATGNGTQYIKQTESYPRLDWQTQPLAIWKLPWLNSFNAFADNTYLLGRTFIQQSAGASWDGTRTIPIVKGIALAPKVDYSQTFLSRYDQASDSFSTATVRDVFIGRYTTAPTLRVGTPLGAWDFTHTYTRRQKADSMTDDAGAIDHGIESNLVSVQDTFSPARRARVRLFTGYDFRVFRDHTVAYRDRVQPFVGDLSYSPSRDVDFSVREDYQLNQKERSFLFNSQYGDYLHGSYIGGGAGYNQATSDQYFLNTEFGIAPDTTSWRVTGALRSLAITEGGISRLSRYRLFEKEIMWTKAWHDFNTAAMIRFRPGGVREITFRINLRLGSMAKESAQHRDWEKEWFPERKDDFSDRP